jgi:ATP-dependent Clp protease protease subunit
MNTKKGDFMWNGNNDSITLHSSRNYMFGDKIFILDEITSENCAYLIGDMASFILDKANSGKELTFIINSPGGEVPTMLSIVGLMNTAKLSDIQTKSIVFGTASSCASMIAANADLRYMNKLSQHFIHFGTVWNIIEKRSEISKTYAQNEEYAENMVNFYLECCKGKMTRKTLLNLESDERGYLNAEDCIKYGLCDFIIEDDLKKKQDYDKFRDAFDVEYSNKYLKPQETKKPKKTTKKGDK